MKEHFFITALLLSFFGAPAVYAASDISPKFDGAYNAATEAVAWMTSGPSCASFEAKSVQIRDGFVATAVRNTPGAIRGFITAEGYLEASVVSVEGRIVPLNGRMDEGLLSAGVIDEGAGCAWLVKLTPYKIQDSVQ